MLRFSSFYRFPLCSFLGTTGQDHSRGVGSPARHPHPISPALKAINPLRNAPYVPPNLILDR